MTNNYDLLSLADFEWPSDEELEEAQYHDDMSDWTECKRKIDYEN